MEWAEHVTYMQHIRNVYKTFVVKLEGTRPRERIGEDRRGNIRMELNEGTVEMRGLDSCGSG